MTTNQLELARVGIRQALRGFLLPNHRLGVGLSCGVHAVPLDDQAVDLIVRRPVILTQPENRITVIGSNATFTVSALKPHNSRGQL